MDAREKCNLRTDLKLSVFLTLVAKIAMARTLHNGLCARELYLGAKTLGERGVRAADQQESELARPAPCRTLRTSDCADTVVDGVTFGERGKRQRQILPHVP